MADFGVRIVVRLTIGSAILVVLSKKLVYSAYALLFTLFGVTGLYVFLWADFLAVVQVVVYIGGILVLIIFGIMLTNKITSVNIINTSVQKSIGSVIILIFITGLGFMVSKTPWNVVANSEPTQTTEAIGRLLMIDYLLPFEAASLLLLGALIGATTLSRKDS